jgi:hypothetical protein
MQGIIVLPTWEFETPTTFAFLKYFLSPIPT